MKIGNTFKRINSYRCNILILLIGFGLLEFIGVICRPIMRPIFKTPGKSAVDAVASFVGSYSIGLLITNKVYKDGGYTHKEAVVVATGFQRYLLLYDYRSKYIRYYRILESLFLVYFSSDIYRDCNNGTNPTYKNRENKHISRPTV